MSEKDTSSDQECPICGRFFTIIAIESHVNKCLFLNAVEDVTELSTQPKRKRTPSPSLIASKPNSSNFNSFFKQDKITKKEQFSQHETKNQKAQFYQHVTKTKKEQFSKHETKTQKEVSIDLSFITPLAKQIQPKCLDDFVGQNEVFGPDSLLRSLFMKGNIPNMILWGPPGCGKTSLAGVINELCKNDPTHLKFISLCAADAGVKDVQNVVTVAKNDLKFGKRTVLFMDEIHRFNKRQQDAFLMHVEKGSIILVGATTENPSFCINSALLSRARVVKFEKLESDDVLSILERAAKNLNIGLIEDDNPYKYGFVDPETKLRIYKSALTWLADTSDGDARIALSNLQLILQNNTKDSFTFTVEDVKEGIKKSHLLYDRKGEEHYNLISALHKSIRGSDDNACLYWLTRMLLSGEDPLYIARRMVRAASEDIGNSDPNALQLAISTMQGCQLLGMPDCDVLLAQCAIYLARAPKSREADTALAASKQLVNNHKGPQPSVPLHIRNAPTKLMKDLGYGKRDANTELHFLPKGYENVNFF